MALLAITAAALNDPADSESFQAACEWVFFEDDGCGEPGCGRMDCQLTFQALCAGLGMDAERQAEALFRRCSAERQAQIVECLNEIIQRAGNQPASVQPTQRQRSSEAVAFLTPLQ